MLDLLGNYIWIPFNKFGGVILPTTSHKCYNCNRNSMSSIYSTPKCTSTSDSTLSVWWELLRSRHLRLPRLVQLHALPSARMTFLRKTQATNKCTRIRNIMSWNIHWNKIHIYIIYMLYLSYKYLQQKYAHKHTSKTGFIKQFYNCFVNDQTNQKSQTS